MVSTDRVPRWIKITAVAGLVVGVVAAALSVTIPAGWLYGVAALGFFALGIAGTAEQRREKRAKITVDT